ncbi:hypothetical protein GO003_012680 [Methylicorpusculum oleiharenae]|uniref:hypothetical protein n=1 Tax=Methylicorpusculum oleiharenae TaxID=1338687 RepID=UPI00135B1EE6|nr:hypothetical protein [Methylicorpusculum oleiharenae]MCD2451249.1 hypothetical protein [Methylicorpusculum oleiharenae]
MNDELSQEGLINSPEENLAPKGSQAFGLVVLDKRDNENFTVALSKMPNVGSDVDFERINDEDQQNRKAKALAALLKYLGRIKTELFDREALHSRDNKED